MRWCPFVMLLILSVTPRAHAAIAVTVTRSYLERPATPFEVYLWPDTVEDDRLNRFQLKLELEGGSPDGLHFSPVLRQPVSHLPLFPGVEFQDLGSDFDTLFVAGALPPGQGADLTWFRDGVLRAAVDVPSSFVPSRISYPILVDGANTFFYDVDGRVVPTGPGAGVILIPIIPEPASPAACLAALAGLALRRRRGG